jgi:hypothetical protein
VALSTSLEPDHEQTSITINYHKIRINFFQVSNDFVSKFSKAKVDAMIRQKLNGY